MKRVVCSGNYQSLFHSMSLAALSSALNSNRLSNRTHPSICLSRSKEFAFNFLRNRPKSLSSVRCVLELDKSKLSNSYNIYPVSDYSNMGSLLNKRSKFARNSKAEERCDSTITNLKDYILKVYIDKSILEFPEGQAIIDSIVKEDHLSVETY